MEYPKTIKLEDEKLKKWLGEKQELIKTGIKKSQDIEDIEEEMNQIDLKIQAIEKTVDIADLHEKERQITKEVEACIVRMEEIKKEIYNRMKENAPTDLYERYEQLKKDKEQAEEDRNKIAIKAQKYNDKLIPYGRKLMQPHLKEKGDDFDTIKMEDGEIVATIFNHFDDFEKDYNKKNNIT